jgi:hypothetical protein
VSEAMKRMLKTWLAFFGAWFGFAAIRAVVTGQGFDPMLDRTFTYLVFAAILLGGFLRFVSSAFRKAN